MYRATRKRYELGMHDIKSVGHIHINDSLDSKQVLNFSLVRTNLKKHFNKVTIKHKSKVMEIFLNNFHDNSFKEITLNISFREGIFQLTDDETPKLVAIKEKE
jgi:hypothetical protein